MISSESHIKNPLSLIKAQRIWPALNQTFVILGIQCERRSERANIKMSVLLHIDQDNCTIE